MMKSLKEVELPDYVVNHISEDGQRIKIANSDNLNFEPLKPVENIGIALNEPQ